MMSARFAMVAAFTVMMAPGPAFGDGADLDPQARAQAEALFQEGSDLLEAGKPAEACPKLQAAVDLTGGEALGGKLVLARCYERLGRTASAWGLYREVAGRAAKSGQTDRAERAEAGAAELGPRLHYLQLVIPPALANDPTLEVAIDDRVQVRSSLSERLPIDPGKRTIRLTVRAGRARVETIEIPSQPGVTRLELQAPGPAPASSKSAPAGGFWSPMRIAGLSVGILGTVGMAAGAAVGGVAKSQYDDAFESGGCAGSPPVCDDVSAIQDARTLGDVGTATFFVGLGVAAVGIVVFAVAPNAERDSSGSQVSLSAGLGSFSARVRF